MTNDQWLAQLLSGQDLAPGEVGGLQSLRDQIQKQLTEGSNGGPRFYYGGSYAKKTMIRASYDLDIVVYWPSSATYTIKDIYDHVGSVLKKHWSYVNSKTVAWTLPFQGGFHIDVVPGRAIDAQYREANLYKSDTGTTLKTSLKLHIDTVRNSNRTDVIRLMKLWRAKRSVPMPKSFLLELMTIKGSAGATGLERQMLAALAHIRDTIVGCSIKDPANSNNSLSDELSASDRKLIAAAARAAIEAKTWSDVFA